jgi:hypothetical protein
MRIFRFQIKKHPSVRTNPLSLVFLALMVYSLYSATINSGYFANYRFGNSIVPHEDQLVRSGPYVMQHISTRRDDLVKFSSVAGREEYVERSTNFNRDVDILAIIKAWEGHDLPVVYLWLYPDNPVRKVWKIEVAQQTVFSYERALLVYRLESSPEFMLVATVSYFVMFLLSMISIEKVIPSLPKVTSKGAGMQKPNKAPPVFSPRKIATVVELIKKNVPICGALEKKCKAVRRMRI